MNKINWPTKKISELIEKVPKVAGVLTKDYQKTGNISILDQGKNFISGYTDSNNNVYTGDLPVILFGDHTRAVKFVDFEFALGADGTKILKPCQDLYPKFFYYAVLSLDIPSRGYARHFKLLKEFEIPLLPLEEQKKIVKVLEEKLGKVKEAIRLREEVISDTEKILPSRLTEIFEEGKKCGWEEKRLDDKSILLMTSGGTPSRSNRDFYQGDIPWLKSGELNDNLNILSSEEHISDEAIKKSSAKVFPAGAVLFAMYGATAGKLGILGISAATNQAVAALIPIEGRLLNVYLYYFLMMKREKIISKAWGGAQPNLSQTIIKTFTVPVPDFETQRKIVKDLDELSLAVSELRKLQESQLADLKSLEQAYLREAFNGGLV